MKIHSFYTTSHSMLKDHFLASLQDDYQTEIECLDNLSTVQEKTKTDAHIGGGRNIWLYRTQKVIDVIRANMGQVILFADIDIKFYKKTEAAIRKCLEGFDVLFQDDQFGGTVVNIGFMAIRCSETTAKFFEEVFAMVRDQNVWEQKAVGLLLEDSAAQGAGRGYATRGGMRWNHLPLEFMPWHMVSSQFTLSSFRRFWRIMKLDFRNIILCHGTEWGATSDPARKVEIYALCEAAMQRPFAWKAGYAMEFIRFSLRGFARNQKNRVRRWLGR